MNKTVATMSKDDVMVFVKSDNHPRTINTPANGRTYYDVIVVNRLDLETKLAELRAKGNIVQEIRTPLGTRIWA